VGGRKRSASSLKQTYYRTFVFLVLVPLLLVFMGAMAVLSCRIRQSSLENISTFQEGLADTLKQEIDENSLQMAHFVYSQDGYFLQLAEKVASASGSVQYNYNNELAEGFQMAMVPAQDIVGGTFYMRNGAQVHMKENILLSTSAVQRERKRHGLL
jgi:two-component system sensor histidine kinase YesM